PSRLRTTRARVILGRSPVGFPPATRRVPHSMTTFPAAQGPIEADRARPSTSVLIPSYNRPRRLLGCLDGLAAQEVLPDEVIVVWQGDDTATRDAATSCAKRLPYPLRVLHSVEKGVVVAENPAIA